MYTIGINNH